MSIVSPHPPVLRSPSRSRKTRAYLPTSPNLPPTSQRLKSLLRIDQLSRPSVSNAPVSATTLPINTKYSTSNERLRNTGATAGPPHRSEASKRGRDKEADTKEEGDDDHGSPSQRQTWTPCTREREIAEVADCFCSQLEIEIEIETTL